MEIKSHILLAKYLMKLTQEADSSKHHKLFLLGCIEPDFNVLSYLKGSMKCQKFRGHNYKQRVR